MKKPPLTLQERFIARLFSHEEGRKKLHHALAEPHGGATALVWLENHEESPFHGDSGERPPWCPDFIERVNSRFQEEEHSERTTLDEGKPEASGAFRPGAHPLHHRGAYYCLDLSSVFSVVPSLEHVPRGGRVLDVCAAPGGKSVLLWRGLEPRYLLANEAIGKRVRPLISNFARCSLRDAEVVSCDSGFLARAFAPPVREKFDLVCVDAPCSGHSLLVKGVSVPGCFHPQTINMNANRQKRILANAAQCVTGGGFLTYMTCTFSEEENEGVSRWFLKKFPEFTAVASTHLTEYQSEFASFPCYRLWPWHGYGAGSFTALFQRTGESGGIEAKASSDVASDDYHSARQGKRKGRATVSAPNLTPLWSSVRTSPQSETSEQRETLAEKR